MDDLVTRTFSEHVAFGLRNLFPKSTFANVIAFLWILIVSSFVKWYCRRQRAPVSIDDKEKTK